MDSDAARPGPGERGRLLDDPRGPRPVVVVTVVVLVAVTGRGVRGRRALLALGGDGVALEREKTQRAVRHTYGA